MEKIRAMLASEKEKEPIVEVGDASDNQDYEADQKLMVAMSAKSAEFDPVTSNLMKEVMDDEYTQFKVEDDSPYPEVRAAVPSTDDVTLPQNTIRMWVLGMILTTLGNGMNILFSFHSPSFALTTFVTSILAYPMGKLWYWVMPNIKIFGVPLNPGPFNVKEHALITIMANVSFGGGAAYATDILLAQNRFYNIDFGWGFALLLIWSTQCIGFAFGGIMRRIVVEPAAAIWPSNLVSAVFLTNLHVNENHPANGWKISRLAFFGIIGLGSFLYYWFPGFLFQALSYFSWVTWIKPDNVIINQVFGSSSGLGMFPNSIALDWNQIAGYIGSPLIPPAGTIATIFASIVVIFWIAVPAIHYSNTWFAQYLPISSSGSFDRFQQQYNVSRIINPKTLEFDPEAYSKYSPLFLSTTFAVSYGLSFASITATVMHTILFHGKDIIKYIKREEKPDVHARLMKAYKECPDWWYVVVFFVTFGMAIAVCRAWPTDMPIWALVISLLIAISFLPAIALIYALTNIMVGLNVISEFIAGYMLQGKYNAMFLVKTFTYITNYQAVTFVQDMKLGHYMKIAPRLLFAAQFIATVWGSLVQVAVLKWAYGAIDGLCTPTQANHYTCPNGKVFFNASIIWGVIGPKRQFSPGQLYDGLLWFFFIGAILPVISWLILKKWPNSFVKYLNWPVFFSGTGYIPPATPYNYTSYCAVGLAFGWWIKRKWFHWWTKYNYSLSAGMDIGLAWCSLIIFLCIGMTNTNAPSWWGNNVINTVDYNVVTNIRDLLPEGQAFGPTSW
ncbi:uncharacterized protein J8A68_003665 [[Candida] subhashii]|uniref:OPT family small oligopeptide transporter n=1 Tax=[Candida] subhashii TaxID=561895 RepID=A0A8J5QD90_9ASCO|nr:uncharacterized protein J8A68_003665 [[Candida] subhashii]KAG7662811.1 hypothetical protein J8A68_003665 [[Candida] subhashii]